MENLGTYKTSLGQSFSCYFDSDGQKAVARGPLPDLFVVAFQVSADSKEEAVEKLAQKIGQGLYC